MLLLVEICNSIIPTRTLALFVESVKGNVEWGWEVPKLSKLFAKIVTKKTSLNDFGIRSSWYGHDAKGHDKVMWIHQYFVMQFVHPYFRVNGICLHHISILSILKLSSSTRNGVYSSK
jgi:hypothetical protein